jgi:nucleoside-diphosphate-sugar epimerase
MIEAPGVAATGGYPALVTGESAAGGSRRVLLTGASGFVGSYAVEPLLDAGYEVHAAARRVGDDPRVRWHPIDLLDRRAVHGLLDELAPSHLLHLAWYVEHGRFWQAGENLTWAGATLELVRAFVERGGRRLVLAGTCAEYDWDGLDPHVREDAPERPATLYGAAKHTTRVLSERFSSEHGASMAWGRIFLLYGPGEDERRLVPAVARALLSGEPAETSDGKQVRDLMHVADVARAFVALLDSEVRGPVNIASGEPVALARVIELVGDATGHAELLRVGALPRRDGEPERLVADVRRLREEVGFSAAVPLGRGIEETVASLARGCSERVPG